MLPFALSPSRAGDFKTCPLLFKLRAIERRPEPPSLPATKGTVTHLCLQRLFALAPAERTVDAALALLPGAWDTIVGADDRSFLFPFPDDADTALADTERFVRNYFDLEDPTRLTPVGLELRLRSRVGALDVVGVLDRLDRHADGTWVVSDYKTGRIPGERREATSFFACKVYALLLRDLVGELPARLRLLYLDEPTTLVVEPTASDVDAAGRLLEAMGRTLSGALDRDEWPARTSYFCNMCPHRDVCPAHAGPVLAAGEAAATLAGAAAAGIAR
ncbi:MAG: PD-(D/E)XK nuclease family protein [Acidimicrobiia bacterium]|nr:PD-(D/E)XK nuclease family protein [Acidimicrobiia bacterium]